MAEREAAQAGTGPDPAGRRRAALDWGAVRGAGRCAGGAAGAAVPGRGAAGRAGGAADGASSPRPLGAVRPGRAPVHAGGDVGLPTAAGLAYGGLDYEPWGRPAIACATSMRWRWCGWPLEAAGPSWTGTGSGGCGGCGADGGRWHLPDGALPVEVPPRAAGVCGDAGLACHRGRAAPEVGRPAGTQAIVGGRGSRWRRLVPVPARAGRRHPAPAGPGRRGHGRRPGGQSARPEPLPRSRS